MIPEFNQSGVLPPFLPNMSPTASAAVAPYKVEIAELVDRFATTSERVEILTGLLNYRKSLRDAGITDGIQWVDGSFVENCEVIRGSAPNDIDIITFAERPINYFENAQWRAFVQQNIDLFDHNALKQQLRCDAFYEDLGLPNKTIVSRVSYWFGLFSHQRVTALWKGLLAIPLQSDDQKAIDILNGRG
jgi:hypothetical protein